MTKEEMLALKDGDIIRHIGSGMGYMVVLNTGSHITAVRAVDVSNPYEWKKIEFKESNGEEET